MKILTYLSLVIILSSCGNKNDVQKNNLPADSSEEEIVDSGGINDTVLLMSLLNEDGTWKEAEAESVIEEEYYTPTLHSEWYDYLLENYDTIASSKTDIDSSAYGGLDICHFEHQFENGIIFEYGGCGEGGANQTIIIPGLSKEGFYELINTKFFSEDNSWNEDSTSYEADGAGCYYSIEISDKTSTISTYCGC